MITETTAVDLVNRFATRNLQLTREQFEAVITTAAADVDADLELQRIIDEQRNSNARGCRLRGERERDAEYLTAAVAVDCDVSVDCDQVEALAYAIYATPALRVYFRSRLAEVKSQKTASA